jgi:hypothetical protein
MALTSSQSWHEPGSIQFLQKFTTWKHNALTNHHPGSYVPCIKSYYCSWCFMYPSCFWYTSVPSWTFNCPLQPWWLTYFLNLILRVSRFFSGQSRSSNKNLLNKSLLKILDKLSQWVCILWDCQCFLNEIFWLKSFLLSSHARTHK